MGKPRFAPALAAGWVVACALSASPALAVAIVEVPADELAAHCAMEFAMPAERVIACRAPDGRLFVPPQLSYNEQGFIIHAQETIGVFCNRREDVLPLLPVSADLSNANRAKPPISSDNIACR
jgi:hypothetical protein